MNKREMRHELVVVRQWPVKPAEALVKFWLENSEKCAEFFISFNDIADMMQDLKCGPAVAANKLAGMRNANVSAW